MEFVGELIDYIPAFWRGLRYTLGLAAIALTLGVVLGLLIALARMSRYRFFRIPATVFVEFFRTTPLVVQIVWIFFVLPVILDISLSSFHAGAIALGMNQAAYKSELFRAGLEEVTGSQRRAARVLGLSRLDAFRFVVAPQAIAVILPAFMAHTMLLVKGTAYVSILRVPELTHTATLISLDSFRFLEVYVVVGVIYFLMIYPLGGLGRWLEKRGSGRWRVQQ
ncbi:MAG: amino acid ABC transporter permease [bacterium]|nr:amino acid ABC transporter permease [bacterium]